MADETGTTRMLGRGGRATIRALIEFHGDYLFGIARALAADAADAETLVRDTLACVLNQGFDQETSVRTSLLAALVREACRPRPISSSYSPSLNLTRETAHLSVHPAADPAGTVIAEARPDLSAVLSDLPMEHRIVIVLRELAGMTYQEMTCTLGVSQATVESRLREARAELSKQMLSAMGNLPGDRRHTFTRP